MPPRMTSTAWGQGATNALICAVGFLVVLVLIGVVLALVSDQGMLGAFAIALAALCALAILVFVGTWLYGRSVGGRILLDCGPHPTKSLFLMNAVLFLIIGLAGGFSATSASDVFAISGPVFGVSFAAYWIIMATGRLQVRENGLWQYWSLLRWGKIGSYRWADDCTLLVRAKGSLSWFQGALPVPPEHKQAVDELLTKHCPVQPIA